MKTAEGAKSRKAQVSGLTAPLEGRSSSYKRNAKPVAGQALLKIKSFSWQDLLGCTIPKANVTGKAFPPLRTFPQPQDKPALLNLPCG